MVPDVGEKPPALPRLGGDLSRQVSPCGSTTRGTHEPQEDHEPRPNRHGILHPGRVYSPNPNPNCSANPNHVPNPTDLPHGLVQYRIQRFILPRSGWPQVRDPAWAGSFASKVSRGGSPGESKPRERRRGPPPRRSFGSWRGSRPDPPPRRTSAGRSVRAPRPLSCKMPWGQPPPTPVSISRAGQRGPRCVGGSAQKALLCGWWVGQAGTPRRGVRRREGHGHEGALGLVKGH